MLGHGLHLQVVRDLDHRRDEQPVAFIGRQAADKAAVDLDGVHVQQFQLRERAEPAAEIVQMHGAAQRSQAGDDLPRRERVADRRGLGELDVQPARVDVVALQQAAQEVREAAAFQRTR